MKWWVSFLLLATVGVGFYFKVIKFDPLSLALLVILLWTQNVAMKRQQQLADVVTKSHAVLAANQKEILKKIEAVRTDIRGLK